MGEQKRFRNLPPDLRAELLRQKTEEQSAPVKLLEERIEQASDGVLTLAVIATAEAANDQERDEAIRAAAVALATLRQMHAAIVQIIPSAPRALIADAITKTIEMSAPNFDGTLRAAMPTGHARRARILEIGPEAFEREQEEAFIRNQIEAQNMIDKPFATAAEADLILGVPAPIVDAIVENEAARQKSKDAAILKTHMTLGEAERASSGEGENNG